MSSEHDKKYDLAPIYLKNQKAEFSTTLLQNDHQWSKMHSGRIIEFNVQIKLWICHYLAYHTQPLDQKNPGSIYKQF